MSATILDQLWEEQVPIRSHNGIGFDIDAFGLGLLADAGEGGLVFLFLERACHYGLLSRRRSCDLVFVLDFRARSSKEIRAWINLGILVPKTIRSYT